MPLFLYIDRSTFLHRLNPIVKVLGMLCFFVAAFVSQRPAVMFPIAGGIAVLLVLARALPNVWRLRVLCLPAPRRSPREDLASLPPSPRNSRIVGPVGQPP